MFDNIGEKIKNFTKFFAIFGMVVSIIIGVIGLFNNPLVGIIIAVLGCLFSWIGSWVLYGYGEIVQRLINIDTRLGGNSNTLFSMTQQANLQSQPIATRQPVTKPTMEFAMPEKDKETLYQFALEQINKGQYKIARNALKRIVGYKDSRMLLSELEDNIESNGQE